MTTRAELVKAVDDARVAWYAACDIWEDALDVYDAARNALIAYDKGNS